MDYELVEKLMAKLEASKLKKLVLKKGDFELQLEKEDTYAPAPKHRMVPEEAFEREIPQKGERGGAARKVEADGKYVTSPMVGTYYSSPAPGAAHFVKVGDRVEEHTIVCIIEAMKVMNEVKAGTSGVIAEILLDNGQPVEFGSKLLRIT